MWASFLESHVIMQAARHRLEQDLQASSAEAAQLRKPLQLWSGLPRPDGKQVLFSESHVTMQAARHRLEQDLQASSAEAAQLHKRTQEQGVQLEHSQAALSGLQEAHATLQVSWACSGLHAGMHTQAGRHSICSKGGLLKHTSVGELVSTSARGPLGVTSCHLQLAELQCYAAGQEHSAGGQCRRCCAGLHSCTDAYHKPAAAASR